MKNLIVSAIFIFVLLSCDSPRKESLEASAKTEEPAAKAPVEFADEKYNEICKRSLTALSSGDIEGFVSNMTDNCVYRFNNGDSISGRPAIEKYWKDRRANMLTKLEFSEDIWLPLTVTEASTQNVRKGTWVLGWFTTDATYKSGKSMRQSIHTLYHFANDEKIDEVIQYLDRAPINAAMKK